MEGLVGERDLPAPELPEQVNRGPGPAMAAGVERGQAGERFLHRDDPLGKGREFGADAPGPSTEQVGDPVREGATRAQTPGMKLVLSPAA